MKRSLVSYFILYDIVLAYDIILTRLPLDCPEGCNVYNHNKYEEYIGEPVVRHHQTEIIETMKEYRYNKRKSFGTSGLTTVSIGFEEFCAGVEEAHEDRKGAVSRNGK